MSKLPYKIQIVEDELIKLSTFKTFEQAQKVILALIKLLDDSTVIDDINQFKLFNDSNGKIKANANWFYEDSVLADRKATYIIKGENNLNIDFKLYGLVKSSKQRVSWITGITSNFEDEVKEITGRYNIGIDFVVPKSYDRIIIVLTNNYVIRTLELKEKLSVTFQEILSKWSEINDFSNKIGVHTALWESFDLQPLNKKFYSGISERFITLRQHLLKEDIFDEKHSSMFANRLIGRVIFTWFLDKKGIINPDLKYFDSKSFDDDSEYYKTKLERLFFGVLNTPIDEREYKDDITPFLNGGLFEARQNDLYKNSKLTFPKNYFDDLFEFLSGYNFTTDESTSQFQQVAIDPEMLGRIFENLLAEITEETGEQARKAKGAFYTPREIVDYMCKESLKEYLKTKLFEDTYRDQRLYQLIDAPDKDFQDQDHNWRRDWKPYKDAIISALDDLKVLDPACGSGAFPIGMLQLLVRVYERLEPRYDSYKAKLQIIEKNIYGVDIEPMAVEIARLRTWLSIVVDEDSDSKKIKPLPNLEFKFVCANSLIDLDKSGSVSFWDDSELENTLQSIRDSYFNTESINKKKKLRNDYDVLVNTGPNMFAESEKSVQLKTYRPFDNESSTGFFDPIFIFGIESFDIVIGNPPYVGEKGNKKTFDNLKSSTLYKKYYLGKMDLFYFFFHIALNVLREKGIVTYITTNYYITATGAVKLRNDIKDRSSILKLFNFGELKIFKSALGQHNMITMLSKGKADLKADTFITKRKGYLGPDMVQSIISGRDTETNYYSLSQDELFSGENIKLTSGGLDDILNKIKKTSLSLCDVANVNVGLYTGADKVSKNYINKYNLEAKIGDGIFLLSDKELKEKSFNDEEIDLCVPVFKNSDISRYTTKQKNDKWLIDFSYPNFIDYPVEKYPNILKHLLKYKAVLENRQSNDNGLRSVVKQGFWWLFTKRKLDFTQEKIVAPQRSKTNTFGYNTIPWFASADVYFITNPKDGFNLKFLLGILNSRLIYVWLYNRGKRKGEMLELYQEPLANIPIPRISSENIELSKQIEEYTLQIIENKKINKEVDTVNVELKIDELVMDFYGLNEEEKNMIRNNVE